MSEFRDKQVMAERFNNNPNQIVTLLEGVLSDEQVAAMEVALFPAPDRTERKAVLEDARQILVRAGIPIEDSAVAALDNEIAAIVMPEE